MSRMAHADSRTTPITSPVEQVLEEVLEVVPSPEEERVLRWRLNQFLELGFDLVSGALMASSPADLGTARRLMAYGCPRDTAVRILL
jgi:hypothetical protein